MKSKSILSMLFVAVLLSVSVLSSGLIFAEEAIEEPTAIVEYAEKTVAEPVQEETAAAPVQEETAAAPETVYVETVPVIAEPVTVETVVPNPEPETEYTAEIVEVQTEQEVSVTDDNANIEQTYI